MADKTRQAYTFLKNVTQNLMKVLSDEVDNPVCFFN